MNTIQSLKELYVKLGGSLTDTYSGIAGGIPVSDYTVIPDMIKALYAIYGGDLTEVYPEISEDIVANYTITPEAIAAVAKVATSGSDITVNESYDISEGTLQKIVPTITGDYILTIPNGITTINNRVLKDERGNRTITPYIITKLIMPNTVTEILGAEPWEGGSAFEGCYRLNEIVFSNSLETIGKSCFSGCTALTSITIPDSVTSIGGNAFINCTSLTDIYYTGTQAEWEAITGISDAGIPETTTIHYEYTPS